MLSYKIKNIFLKNNLFLHKCQYLNWYEIMLLIREFEEKVTLEEVQKKNSVISLGGGAFINAKIRNYVILNTKSFWLHLDISLLEQRLINSKRRPLLVSKNIRLDLDKIYKKRVAAYSLAKHKIDCNNLTTSLISKKIITLYEND